jgi:hypothetical protein
MAGEASVDVEAVPGVWQATHRPASLAGARMTLA